MAPPSPTQPAQQNNNGMWMGIALASVVVLVLVGVFAFIVFGGVIFWFT